MLVSSPRSYILASFGGHAGLIPRTCWPHSQLMLACQIGHIYYLYSLNLKRLATIDREISSRNLTLYHPQIMEVSFSACNLRFQSVFRLKTSHRTAHSHAFHIHDSDHTHSLKCTQSRCSGLPSSNQGLFKAEPRHGRAVCTLRMHPPTSPCPTLSAGAEPISQGHCRM